MLLRNWLHVGRFPGSETPIDNQKTIWANLTDWENVCDLPLRWLAEGNDWIDRPASHR